MSSITQSNSAETTNTREGIAFMRVAQMFSTEQKGGGLVHPEALGRLLVQA